MRTTRLLCLVLFCFLTILIIFSAPRHSGRSYTDSRIRRVRKKAGIRALFSFRTPLFSSSAIISLTDDNSTFFLSRPAAFGPLLPRHGLSGQLWIGSGFGEDPRGWVGAERIPEGELGCSDVPGWDENLNRLDRALLDGTLTQKPPGGGQKKTFATKNDDRMRRSAMENNADEVEQASTRKSKDDGTDDYLHQPLVETASISNSDSAADLKSLQESAEIAGKIVLLSRGGCGFLEKVKWVQRRGGLGLIVGDNIPGGALVTMYAKGDTSDVMIPAIFTSHTTAHLLSSLIPPNGLLGSDAMMLEHKGSIQSQKPSKSTPSRVHSGHNGHQSSFLKRVLSFLGLSGRDIEEPILATPKHDTNDDFVIGVHDWRDPAVISTPNKASSGTHRNELVANQAKRKSSDGTTASARQSRKVHDMKSESESIKSSEEAKIGSGANQSTAKPLSKSGEESTSSIPKSASVHEKADPHHEGLWVTLTPTSMSSSPFFDTILVLVISPLITLTVVYAVLLIRSRIRRRRWRAPKSVVERLPVRTYQTIPSSGASTTALATPVASSPTTPLLQHMSGTLRPPIPRSRSRSQNREQSRNATESHSPFPQDSDDEEENPSMTESEKREKGLAEWRRRYGGKQKECVVCLEEYVDGVSQVMSLPCGHEFHVDCITPWLTTRRRTCPICKGDVVRSLARQGGTSSASGNRLDSNEITDEDDDSIQTRAALLRNDSPSAQEPIPAEGEDVERGFARDENEGGVIYWLADRWEQGRQVLTDWRSRRSWRLGRRGSNEVDRDR